MEDTLYYCTCTTTVLVMRNRIGRQTSYYTESLALWQPVMGARNLDSPMSKCHMEKTRQCYTICFCFGCMHGWIFLRPGKMHVPRGLSWAHYSYCTEVAEAAGDVRSFLSNRRPHLHQSAVSLQVSPSQGHCLVRLGLRARCRARALYCNSSNVKRKPDPMCRLQSFA